MRPLKLEFSLQKDELIDAQYFFSSKTSFSKRFFYLAILFTFLWVFKGAFMSDAGHPMSYLIGALVGAAFAAFSFGIIRRLVPLIHKKVSKGHGICNVPSVYEFQSDRVHIATPQSDGHVKWGGFKTWYEHSTGFLLSIGHGFYLIPLRVLNDEQKDSLRSLLEEKIGPKG